MSRYLRSALAAGAALALSAGAAATNAAAASAIPVQAAPERVLSICADPNNMPYSNERHEGFEDRIAAVLAADLHARVTMVWGMQRLGFLRRTLQARRCDVVMGVPPATRGLATTRPYYRSSYVFVTQRARAIHLAGFDDPALRGLRIGLQAIGANGDNPPPAESLGERGMGRQVTGFAMYDIAAVDSPAGRIIDAVADGTVDVAAVWGPLAGYFGKRYADRLEITRIEGDPALPAIPFAYDMAIGVRRDDSALCHELDAALGRHEADIAAILADFRVPVVPPALFPGAFPPPAHAG